MQRYKIFMTLAIKSLDLFELICDYPYIKSGFGRSFLYFLLTEGKLSFLHSLLLPLYLARQLSWIIARRYERRGREFESLTSHQPWRLGRLGVCAGLKILRTWFESTRLHIYILSVIFECKIIKVMPILVSLQSFTCCNCECTSTSGNRQKFCCEGNGYVSSTARSRQRKSCSALRSIWSWQ